MYISWYSCLNLEIMDLHIKSYRQIITSSKESEIIADATMLVSTLEKTLSAKLPCHYRTQNLIKYEAEQ